MPHPLTILHCLRAPRGGVLRHVDDLARAQSRDGHRVGIVCDTGTGNPRDAARLDALERDLPLGVTRIAMPRTPGIADVHALRSVTRRVSEITPDVVHGHGAKGGLYGRLAATRIRRRTGRVIARIYTPHGGSLHFDPGSFSGRIYLGTERWLLRATDGLVFVSDYEAATFRERVAEPTCPACRVHNGLMPEEFEPVVPAPDAADVLYLGELRMLKGVDVLLEAIARLRPQRVTAAIVGAGPDAEVFRVQAETLELSMGRGDMVRFHTPMPAREAFRLGRVLVMPSRAESLPYVVLEAVAAGMPLIASRVGGIPEILPADAPELVPPGDAIALAGAIACMRDDLDAARARARSRAAAARDTFSVARMSLQITGFYRGILDFMRSG